jgi:dTDP-glucose pyrophosphorylase
MTPIKVVLFHLQNFQNITYLDEIKDLLKNNGYQVLDKDLNYVIDSEFTTKEILIVTNYQRCLQLSRKLQYNICYIFEQSDLTFDYIYNFIKYYECPNHGIVQKTIFKKKLNIIIVLNLEKFHFDVQRDKNNPLITINNKPLIAWIIENIQVDGNYYFVTHMDPEYNDYGLENLLYSLVPDCTIVKSKRRQEGSACYLLEVEKYIDNDYPIIISSDRQWLKWDCENFLFDFLIKDTESIAHVITFLSNGSHKYNYVKVDQTGNIINVRQNVPISCFATTGIYFWKSSKNLFKYIHKMISKNKRTKGEFHIAPILNELIEEIGDDSKDIVDFYNKKLSDIEVKYLDKDIIKYHDQILSEINIVENEMKKSLKNTKRITKKECFEFKELNDANDITIFKNYLMEEKMRCI